jgi:hypothetical protein
MRSLKRSLGSFVLVDHGSNGILMSGRMVDAEDDKSRQTGDEHRVEKWAWKDRTFNKRIKSWIGAAKNPLATCRAASPNL